ncbi:Oms1p [Sugiyamaella lignohabitans]|uniref:Oms1p n=1 Tax=Sugiyamaella lignohabitans TaxID=796027 RepID=A0A167CUV9_9ASCO|nr:Oms1p [Sugiyamaella lignohabitans]ANB12133.1 Oms1p [Sugiyamaella lignohabitans]
MNSSRILSLSSQLSYTTLNTPVISPITQTPLLARYASSARGPIRPAKVTNNPTWIKKLKLRWRKMDDDPVARKRFAMAVIAFYMITGFFGFQYLQDTKYRATGEANPYKPMDGSSADSTTKAAGTESAPGIVEPRDTTDVYESLAKEYDDKIWLEELTSYIWWTRRRLMRAVEGDALEVSCGTGRNIKYLDPKKVNSITYLDSSPAMLEVTKEKFEKRFPNYKNVQYVKGRAEDLVAIAAKSGQKFNTIFESFGLCSHEDPAKALQNFRQLLKPNGRIVLLEHGRSTYASVNERMDRTAEKRAQEWGCRWNLDIDHIVKSSGLQIVDEGRYHFGSTYFYILKAA